MTIDDILYSSFNAIKHAAHIHPS